MNDPAQPINTEGGDFVARDKIIYSDVIYGNKNVFTAEALEKLLPKPYKLPALPRLEGGLVEHADLPPGSRMPFPRNYVFTERQEAGRSCLSCEVMI